MKLRPCISLLAMLAILMSPVVMAAPMPSSIGYMDQKGYTDAIDQLYKEVAEKIPVFAQMGLLKVESNLVSGPFYITVTIDNATSNNVYSAVGMGSVAYNWFYRKYGWPDEAKIFVNNAGGTQLGCGEVYSKWVEDDIKANTTDGKVFSGKVINATRIWTWALPT